MINFVVDHLSYTTVIFLWSDKWLIDFLQCNSTSTSFEFATQIHNLPPTDISQCNIHKKKTRFYLVSKRQWMLTQKTIWNLKFEFKENFIS